MATRVADPKDKKFTSLLDWILKDLDIDSVHQIRVHDGNYTMHQAKNGEIILSSEGLFLERVNNFDEVLHHLSILEKRNVVFNDINVTLTFSPEEDVDEYTVVKRGNYTGAQVSKDFFPQRFSKRSGIEAYGKRFYISKKGPNGVNSKYSYNVYSWSSRLFLFSNADKDICEAWIRFGYPKVARFDTVDEQDEYPEVVLNTFQSEDTKKKFKKAEKTVRTKEVKIEVPEVVEAPTPVVQEEEDEEEVDILLF